MIFKVMVCFLAVFRSEFYVGGLPTIQDSPDNHHAGQSGRSASNQGVANEPAGSRTVEVLDYAENHEEELVRREVEPEIMIMKKNPVVSLSDKTAAASIFFDNSSTGDENSGTRRSNQFLDKSESIDLQHRDTTSHDFTTTELHRVPTSSPGAREAQRFSSVYTTVELDDKVNKKKQEFKNDLSVYLSDVIDTVVNGKDSTTTTQRSGKKLTNENNSASYFLTDEKDVPEPEEESKYLIPVEYRQRKSVGDVGSWHQQSTNMRPTRTQHLVKNKRTTGEGTLLKLPGYGVRKSARSVAEGNRGSNRRQFNVNSSFSSRGNQLQLGALNPVQVNKAARAYGNRQIPQQALNIDLSRALFQFSPAQLHSLRGVFDKVPPSTENFKPIPPKQVAYVAPRIVHETKIIPTPFMPFRTEQKTVEALSALLGKNPAQQLEGFNLILRNDRPGKATIDDPTPAAPSSPPPEISRQSVNEAVALRQNFVTPIPSIDINSGLGDGTFRFSPDGRDPNEEIGGAIESPFNHRAPQYTVPETIDLDENRFRTIPVVEQQGVTVRDEPEIEREVEPAWRETKVAEIGEEENDGRSSSEHDQEGNNYGEGYAAKYSFGYHVKDYESGNNFGHQESRDGAVTNGRYHVLLPDGRVQNVKYHVDEGGYHAKVSYHSSHTPQ